MIIKIISNSVKKMDGNNNKKINKKKIISIRSKGEYVVWMENCGNYWKKKKKMNEMKNIV